jgi:hypothetical protein
MNVHERVAFCGLSCDSCPVRWATMEEDRAKQGRMRTVIAQKAREQYGMELQPEDVTDCDGCRTENGRLFSGCQQCAIRECAKHKNLGSCAMCGDYACEKLQKFFSTDPEAKMRLEFIRAAG